MTAQDLYKAPATVRQEAIKAARVVYPHNVVEGADQSASLCTQVHTESGGLCRVTIPLGRNGSMRIPMWQAAVVETFMPLDEECAVVEPSQVEVTTRAPERESKVSLGLPVGTRLEVPVKGADGREHMVAAIVDEGGELSYDVPEEEFVFEDDEVSA